MVEETSFAALRLASCAGCNALTADDAQTVTLLSGAVVCNACPAWAAECRHFDGPARRILELPSREARRDRIQQLRAEFGDAYADRMEQAVRTVHGVRRQWLQKVTEASTTA